MITDTPNLDGLEGIIRRGLESEISKIVDEETEKAKERVASRVAEMKTGALAKILARFRMTRVDNPASWTISIRTEI